MQKQLAAAARERQRLAQAVEQCPLCPSNSKFLQLSGMLEISRSEHIVIRLKPIAYSLCEGHVEIIPMVHAGSLLKCDEETKVEVDR